MKKRFFYINDPIYGFIDIKEPIFRAVINHNYFQRLRRIHQTGLSYLVYPSANHTRFSHSLGVYFLMEMTIEELRKKKADISYKDEINLRLAGLLHDIGHSPFSHVLERFILPYPHEVITKHVITLISRDLGEDFSDVIKILSGEHKLSFINSLISSQIDLDRIDYLNRDSFFTGVAEGTIGYNRLIKTFVVVDGALVSEEKALLSIENFLHARSLMYKQVYLHKTVLSAENVLISIINRAKFLYQHGENISLPLALKSILNGRKELTEDVICSFLELDDYDIMFYIKEWTKSKDRVLSLLSNALLRRRLFKAITQKDPVSREFIHEVKNKLKKKNLNEDEINYLIIEKTESFSFYKRTQPIIIVCKNGEVVPMENLSSLINAHPDEEKIFCFCYPKESFFERG